MSMASKPRPTITDSETFTTISGRTAQSVSIDGVRHYFIDAQQVDRQSFEYLANRWLEVELRRLDSLAAFGYVSAGHAQTLAADFRRRFRRALME